MKTPDTSLIAQIENCTICAERFEATETRHKPRPVVWFRPDAKILIAGQAPGMRVHNSGRPFSDPSGDRLRDWMGVDENVFYDKERIAIVPMAFCFPGYDTNGGDIAPPRLCARTWRDSVMELLGQVELTLLVGGYAQQWHLGARGVTQTVRNWTEHAPAVFPLPHPSWRNTGWLRKNPWFETDVIPALQGRVKEVLGE